VIHSAPPGAGVGNGRSRIHDPLPGFAVAADRYNLTTSCHVHLLHNNVNTEDICGKRQREMILHHREETDSPLLLGMRIHDRLLNQFLQFRLAE
jgi:hypothetical protein